jgi:glycosyltransferase involved in cell wall biosynthesis
VDPRDTRLFDQINLKLMNSQSISLDEEYDFIENNINSKALCEYLSENRSKYVFFFIPYMFGTTYFGSQVCPERSFLIPCLHDESYAYLRIFKHMFENARGLLFLSEPELELARRIFDLAGKTAAVVGVGIDTDVSFDAARFRSRFGVDDEFVLYVGRKDATKNTPLLIDLFCRYVELRDTQLKLVLNGQGCVSLPNCHKDRIIELKPASGQDKLDAYSAALVTAQPSVHESFSIVIMESWVCGTPVLVHGDCDVTKYHCTKSNGGLYFRDFDEFAGCLDLFTHNSHARRRMGENGRRYVIANYTWQMVLDRYLQLIRTSIDDLGGTKSDL